MSVTRRDFFRIGGSAALGLALANSLNQQAVMAEGAVGAQMGVLIDISRCIGCRSCESACQKANSCPRSPRTPGNRKLTAHTWTFVDKERLQMADKQTADTLRQAPVHALPGAGLRLGVSGRRAAEGRQRRGGL